MRPRIGIRSGALSAWRVRLAGEDGYSVIELSVAMIVLTIGLLGALMGFNSAQRLSLVSERHATMAHVAQREIERIEGVAFSQIALNATPGTSTNQANPDYYVSTGSPPKFQWDRTNSASTEPLVLDTTNGAVAPVQNWTEGNLSGSIYDFVTWTADPNCTTSCASGGQDYKRVTVAVTMGGGLQPYPVYVSSVVANPAAAPQHGVLNGQTGNPLKSPSTYCESGSQIVACTSPIDSGNPNVWFLHDWSAWNSGTPVAPSANNITHNTVNVATGGVCTNSTTTGCPQPDLMDGNAPSGGTSTPCYVYSSDQSGTAPCARLIQPTSDSGCTQGSAALSSLSNTATELWVTAPLASAITLTGEGGFSTWSQTANGTAAVVTLCIAIYDVPSSISNLLNTGPTYLGAASFQPPTDPATSSNWPMTPTATSFIFNFRGSSGTVQVAAGHRLGVRIWANTTPSTPIDFFYDNPSYPSQLQLNSQ